MRTFKITMVSPRYGWQTMTVNAHGTIALDQWLDHERRAGTTIIKIEEI